jgi:hypothetical protein
MNQNSGKSWLFALVLIFSPLSNALETQPIVAKNTPVTSDTKISVLNERRNQDIKNNPPAIDSTTSASVLSAKSSHVVSKHDETGLSIFLGLIILSVIGFFLKPFR